MNPWDGLAKFVNGWIAEGHMQKWWRLGVSVALTAFIAFFGTWGVTGLAYYVKYGVSPAGSLLIGLLTAFLVMAGAVAALVKTSKLARDLKVEIFLPKTVADQLPEGALQGKE